MEKIDQAILTNSITYSAYRTLIDDLLAQEKTTGDDHSSDKVAYTRLNVSRMKRLDKTTRLSPLTLERLSTIVAPATWLVLTEAWCGDAAQIIPVLQKMAYQNNKIALRLIFRDEHPQVMDSFLTNGARSIPKVIIVNQKDLSVDNTWGPRPNVAQEMMMSAKEERNKILTNDLKNQHYTASLKALHTWYARDKCKSIQMEFLETILPY